MSAKKLQPMDFELFRKTTKFSELFETKPCSRCGGLGRYSWCEMYGDTCFKCNGSGKYFTKRGQEMREAYISQRKLLAVDVEIGKRYHGFGYKFTVAIKTIDADKITIVTEGGMTINIYISDNPKVEFLGLTVEERYQHYLNVFKA